MKPEELEVLKNKLTPEQYRICFGKGTEVPYTNQYYHCNTEGQYHCVVCDAPLFDSSHKYDSGSGWPSFYQTIDPARVKEHLDQSHGMVRTEVVCSRCQSHLGHLFPDGPEPTGVRYCINSTSLRLQESNKE